MSVFRIPAAVTTTDPNAIVHWYCAERTDIWHNPQGAVIACGGDGKADHGHDRVTCEACLDAVVRRRCLAVEDTPGPLPARCRLLMHKGPHEWEQGEPLHRDLRRAAVQREAAESAAASAVREALSRRAAEEGRHPELVAELDTPSGRLPVRTPGEALREAEGEVIETWSA